MCSPGDILTGETSPGSSIYLLTRMTTLISEIGGDRYTKHGDVVHCIATGVTIDLGDLDCDPLEAAAMLVQVSSTLHYSCCCISRNQYSKFVWQRFPEPLAAL